MVYSGNGISYTELKAMDLAEFNEAVEAKIILQKEAEERANG